MELKIGLWQIIEVLSVVYATYKHGTKHGQVALDQTKIPEEHKKYMPGIIKTLCFLEVIFWIFVVYMGGLAPWALLAYTVATFSIALMVLDNILNNIETFKYNIYGTFLRQAIYQGILFTGGFYTQAPLINF